MGIGELKPLSKTQKRGLAEADAEMKRLVKLVQEEHSKYPKPKRKAK